MIIISIASNTGGAWSSAMFLGSPRKRNFCPCFANKPNTMADFNGRFLGIAFDRSDRLSRLTMCPYDRFKFYAIIPSSGRGRPSRQGIVTIQYNTIFFI